MEAANLNYRKSSYSSSTGGECIEVADATGTVAVRDTKQAGRADRTVVTFARGAWAAFVASIK